MAADFPIGADKTALLPKLPTITPETIALLKRSWSEWATTTPLSATQQWLCPTAESAQEQMGGLVGAKQDRGFVGTIAEMDDDVRDRIRKRFASGTDPARINALREEVYDHAADTRILTRTAPTGAKVPKHDIRHDLPSLDMEALLKRLLK